MITPADHAATVREALGTQSRFDQAHAALDALQAQAEEQALAIAAYLTRAEAAEAERDRVAVRVEELLR